MSRLSAFWSGLSVNGRRGVVGGGIGALALAVGGVAILVSGGDPAPEEPPPTTTTTESTTTTTEAPKGPIAPLTGLLATDEALLKRPPLAVKVDNLDAPSETAVPQAGLRLADVVYEEVVEGNITRLVVVFHSQQPGRVGPVRSARTTDVNLLPQLGRPLLSWSGGNQGVVNAVRSSPSIIDVGWDAVPSAYARDRSRRAPHNLYVQANELWGAAPKDLPAPPPIFEYRGSGQKNPSSARRALGVDITWGRGAAVAPVSWRWDGGRREYIRTQRGRPHRDEDGSVVTAKNVVVMVTTYGQSGADARSPEAKTVGSGELFVFSNGRVMYGKWDRPDINKPAKLINDRNKPILLSPGQTWVELPRPGNTSPIWP